MSNVCAPFCFGQSSFRLAVRGWTKMNDFERYHVRSTYTIATLNEVLSIIHSQWFLVFWIFMQ
jgi:hypothetical protein